MPAVIHILHIDSHRSPRYSTLRYSSEYTSCSGSADAITKCPGTNRPSDKYVHKFPKACGIADRLLVKITDYIDSCSVVGYGKKQRLTFELSELQIAYWWF